MGRKVDTLLLFSCMEWSGERGYVPLGEYCSPGLCVEEVFSKVESL